MKYYLYGLACFSAVILLWPFTSRGSECDFAPSFGTNHVLVILVNFADTSPTCSAVDFNELFFGSTAGTVNHYYQRNSYGAFEISGRATDWVTASENHDYYSKSDYGQGRFKSYPNNAHKLVEEAVDLVASGTTVDFSHYDNTGDGCVDSLVIVHQGEGGEISENKQDIWSFMGSITAGGGQARTYDGVLIDRFAIVSELYEEGQMLQAGLAAHEYVHMLGLKDHYDKDRSSHGLGVYDLMSAGVWGGDLASPGSPVHLSVYNKMFLGWVDPLLISGTTEGTYDLGAVENYPHALKIPANPRAPEEYYLVSNREDIGYDYLLPAYGIAVFHVDERNRFENRDELTGCGYHFPLTALEQADGNYDLENKENYGDSTDMFPAAGGGGFTHGSIPSSLNHDCRLSGVAVTGIGSPGNTVSVTVTANDKTPYSGTPFFQVDELSWTEDTGDGDPYLEAGEKFAVSLTLLNNGSTAVDVTVGLSCEYPYLSFGSTLLDYPSMGIGETASASNSVYMSVNSGYHAGRSYPLNITVTHDGATTVLTPQVRLGEPEILYVDDDGGDFTERHLAYSLQEEAGYHIDRWSVEENGSPALADLSFYEFVVWITGAVRDTPLSSSEISALSGYLDGGGTLILSSPYLLFNPGSEASDFAINYLHVQDYVDDRYAGTRIKGIEYDPVSHTSSYFDTKLDHFYYPLQNRSIALTAGSGARGCILNGRSNNTAVCYPDESSAAYRSIFISLGLENAGKDDAPYVLWRLLQSFNYKTDLPFVAYRPYSLQPKEVPTLKFWGWGYTSSLNFSFIEDDVSIVEQTYNHSRRYTLTLKVEIDAEQGFYDMLLETDSGDTVLIENIIEVSGEPVANKEPVAKAGLDATYNYSEQVPLDGSSSYDPDYDDLTYEWDQLQGTTVTLLPSNTSVSPYFQPTSDHIGDNLFSLTVSDPYDQDGDTINISIINDPPVADAGPDREGYRSDTFTLDGSSSHDPEDDLESLVWQQLQGASVDLQPSSTVKTPSFTPAADFVGTYKFEISLQDPFSQSSDTVSVLVKNHPPVSDAGPDMTGNVDEQMTLDGSSSYDLDGDPLDYQWTQLGGTTVSLDTTDPQMPTFTSGTPDNFVFSLLCEDPYDPSQAGDSVEVVITSDGNHVPEAEAGPGQTVDWGDPNPVQLDGSSSSDPDGDALTYEWSLVSIPDGSSTELSDPASQAPTFDDDEPGEYKISLRVSDGEVWSFLDYVTIVSEDRSTDTDGDGLENSVDPDDDNDLMPDQWEVDHGLDPLDSADGEPFIIDSVTDPDGDGNTNIHEYVNQSNPQVADAYTCTGGLGGCYFGDSNKNYVFDSGDISVLMEIISEEDVSADPLYPENGENMDIDGDGVVTSSDYSVLRSLVAEQDKIISGAPYEMSLVSPGYSVTIDQGDTLMIDVKFFDNPLYMEGLTTSRPGLAAQFEVVKGKAYILGGEESLPSTVTLDEVSELNTAAQESTFTLSRDGLEVFVTSNRSGGAGGFDLYRATRPDTGSAFGTLQSITAINTTAHEISPAITADGLTLYFLRYSEDTHWDIYFSTRPDTDSDFGSPQPLVELNSSGYEGAMSVTDDHLVMYLTKYSSTAGYQIYRSTRPDTSTSFYQPEPVEELNTSYDDYLPTINGDETKIYFASNRPASNDGTNIWYATRSSSSDPFSGISSLELLNSDDNEYKVWENTSETTLFFSTSGFQAGDDLDIYQAARESPDLPYWASMYPGRYEVTDSMNSSGDSNARVWLYPEECGLVKVRAHLQEDYFRDLPALSLPDFINVHVNCP